MEPNLFYACSTHLARGQIALILGGLWNNLLLLRHDRDAVARCAQDVLRVVWWIRLGEGLDEMKLQGRRECSSRGHRDGGYRLAGGRQHGGHGDSIRDFGVGDWRSHGSLAQLRFTASALAAVGTDNV